MPRQFEHDVFVSYSSKDRKVVHELTDRLTRDGLRVWRDEQSMVGGEWITTSIEKGVRSSRVFLACLSRHYATSKWAKWEQNLAHFGDISDEDLRFVPLRLDDAPVDETIKPYHYIDYRPLRRRRTYAAILKACSPPRTAAFADSGISLRLSEKCVRPLHVTEDRYLQLLLSAFTVVRNRRGFELRFSFNDDTPTIWDQSGKRHLLDLLPEKERKRYQKELDAFLLGGNGKTESEYQFHDEKFVFRYGSGGTLPIIAFHGGPIAGEYYCFFYRDVPPIGWNIANGGTDSRSELHDPRLTIERELCEEVIIADFVSERRYVFAEARKRTDHAAHLVARRLWAKFASHRKFDDFKAKDIHIRWMDGPDSLRVNDRKPIDGFFLNINGEDFGIEVDRVARMRLPGDVILFDGEIDGAHLVNAPVGLFDVQRFNRRLKREGGSASFRPDHFFFSAALHHGARFDQELENGFIPHARKFREPDEIEHLQRCMKKEQHLRLCPVTERIVRRFRRMGA